MNGLLNGHINGKPSGKMLGTFGGCRSGRSAFRLLQKQNTPEPPSPWDADFLAFWARTSGTPETWKTAYNKLFLDFKAYSIYNKLDVLRISAAHNEADARLNLLADEHNAIAVNSPVFTQKIGFETGGGYGYLDSNFNTFDDGVNYQMANASCGIYSPDVADASITQVPFGAFYSSSIPMFATYSGGFLGGINMGSYSITSLPGSVTGVIALTRENSTHYNIHTNKSALSVAATAAYSSGGINVFELAQNNFGTPSAYFLEKSSMFFAGAFLTQSQLDSIQDVIIPTFLDAIAAL